MCTIQVFSICQEKQEYHIYQKRLFPAKNFKPFVGFFANFITSHLVKNGQIIALDLKGKNQEINSHRFNKPKLNLYVHILFN